MAPTLLNLTPGRDFRWAPAWDCSEHQVLFDAASGDYWVLTQPARRLLELLQAEGAREREQLMLRLDLPADEVPALLDNLQQARLIEASVDGVPLRPALAADTAD